MQLYANFKAFRLNIYAINFGMVNSCGRQSKALNRSAGSDPNTLKF